MGSGYEAGYYFLYEEISDILFGGTVTIRSKPNVVSSRTIGPTTINEYFKKELYIYVHFGMAKMFVADIDLQIYLFPDGFSDSAERVLLTEDADNGNIRLISQDDAQAEFFVALFDIPKKYQRIPETNQIRTRAEILVLCRCKDNSHIFPIEGYDNDTNTYFPRYIGVREKLYVNETDVKQPETPFNSKLLAKQEEERKRELVCVTVSGDQIKRKHKNKLFLQETWD